MLKEFAAFINRGNALDLAVGVIIGAAFGKIVTALTDDLIMPIVSIFTGGVDFANMFIILKSPPATYTGSLTSYAELKKAGVPMFAYGDFINAVINFVILAFVVFMIVRTANKMLKRTDEDATPENVLLLRQLVENTKK